MLKVTWQCMVGDVDDVAAAGKLWSVVVLVRDGDGEVDSGGSRFGDTAVLSHQSEVVDISLFPVK